MPRLLIDTQVLLWWLSDDTRLGPVAAGRLARDPVLVSVASLWEIAIKAGRGELDADVRRVAQAADAQGMRRLPLGDAHLARYQALPRRDDHGDPFDRMLLSQALAEELPLLTADGKMAGYGVEILDAER